ncbi:MAG: hypothetical protein K2K70_10725, partial [Lachnospiraceae bacterium]|nr:hypothetical protein [Lachnospiraceae bacterium]
CVNHPKASVVVSAYAKYDQYELEKNIYFSIAIVVLFLVTWSFFRMEKAYRRMCYFWIIVPVLSLAILSRPMIVIQTDDIYPITDMNYNGFQVLAYGSLTNEYKDIVIDRGNLGFVMIKIMIALQLIFDVVLVIIALWEWRKKRNPKYFLCLRGGLTVGYVLTSVIIYRITEWWFDNLEIEHALGAFLMRTSYAFGEWGVYMTLIFSIAIAILFVVSLLAFCLTPKKKGSKMKRNKIYRLLYFLWFFVPVLSLVRLSQPMLGIEIGGECAPGSDPVKLYNGFQLLVCRYLRNGYNHIVTDMSNPGFDILKIMIALQLVCDVILISICLREWREKQTSERFLRLRGMLSMGYVLTAFLFYQFIPVCDNHLKVDLFESFISYIQYEYIFSFGVVVLFIITWLFFCKEKAIKIRREKVPEQKG